MGSKSRLIIYLQLLILIFGVNSLPAIASIAEDTERPITEDLLPAATDVYIYGYPLVTMEMTRRVMTNVYEPAGKYAPVGQFAHLKEYPTAADKEVTAPNADTLYSLAWLDLSKEPYIVHIPDAQGRYYLMPMLDAWTNVFADPGTRTTGTKAQDYAITGPDWSGQLPHGMKEYKSPTDMVWILGRTYCTGTLDDYNKVHGFQDELLLLPLSHYLGDNGKHNFPDATPAPHPGPVDPDLDIKTPVREQVNQMDADTYFQLLAQLLKSNPPAVTDKSMIVEMSKIGIVPGQDLDINKVDLSIASALHGAPRSGQDKILSHIKESDMLVNGWARTLKTGTYGNDYLQRACVAAIGLGANLPEDAVYPISEVDVNGKAYNGANKYVIHFAKGQTPPVNGFWSLTMYDDKYFFVPNSLNRANLSSKTPFKYNADGSLDIYIQKESPGKDKETNWLPAPEGKFVLMLRMYWPKPEVIEGKYTIPAVQSVD